MLDLDEIDRLLAGGEGEEAHRRLLQVARPDHQVWKRIGNYHLHRGELAEAEAAYRSALALNPDFADAHYNLGIAATAAGDHRRAIAHYQDAHAIDPDDFMITTNLAVALVEGASFGEARRLLEPLIDRYPQQTGWIALNLARVCNELADHQAALAWARRAVADAPPGSEIEGEGHYTLALQLLLSGQFAEGIALHERRLNLSRFAPPPIPQPIWDGSPLHGETLLLYTDQGFGDAIQFARYIPWLTVMMGARVVVLCRQPLRRLMMSIEGVSQVVVEGVDPLPEFATWLPMLSLAQRHGSLPESIRFEQGYIDIAPGPRPPAIASDGLRVGLVWSGSRGHQRDRIRSIDAQQLLGQLPRHHSIHYYSLQPDPLARSALPGSGVIDLADQLTDFAETAHILHHLDLLVTVDTSVAHLAGAIARPVWTLLPLVPDWRWGLDGEETPWYSTMRLFRQQQAGDWSPVISRVSERLLRMAGSLPDGG